MLKSTITFPHRRIQQYEQNQLCLNMNENHFPHHPDVTTVTSSQLSAYPRCRETHQRTLCRIKDYCRLQSSDNILLTNGSDDAIRLLLSLFPGKNMLLSTPTYAFVLQFIDIFNINAVKIPNNDIKLMDVFMTDVDVIYLVNPTVPAGDALDTESIKSLTVKYPKKMFIVDEAYIEYMGNTDASLAEFASTSPNTCVLRTFSKAFGLASLRIGYIVGHEDNIDALVKCYGEVAVCDVSKKAASIVLDNVNHYMKNVEKLQEIKKYTSIQLRKIGIDHHVSKYGMTILLYMSNPVKFIQYMQNNHHISLCLFDQIKESVRVTVSTEHNMNAFLKACSETIRTRCMKRDHHVYL